MNQNQRSTVQVTLLPATAPSAVDILSISAVVADGGATTAAIPATAFANGYCVSVEEASALSSGSRRYIVDLSLVCPMTGAPISRVRLDAPSREAALEVQRELSEKIPAALRPGKPPETPAAQVDPVHRLARFSRFSRYKRLTIGGFAAGGILVAGLVFAMGHRSQPQRSEPAPQPDIASGAVLASPGFPQPLSQLAPIAPSGTENDMDVTGNRLNDVDMGNLKAMGEKVGIQLRSGEVPFYVLADPACAACRALEPIWTQVPARYKPIVIPVGFQTGGEDLAIGIQCSKDPVASWKKTLAGDESLAAKSQACKEGTTKVNAGNLFFHYLRLTGTPTIIAPNGVVAAGGDTAETLTAFLKQNETRQ
ncbi:thioredoxin fold domain-containing protein (plasmid) [Cupriavidus pinatubonensis]|uniref:thioredoxin fold domain-containing protein n=1 Tax=Cupriavidus pinatubonensis TaxID=248026 RepID=UPI001C73DDC3|nr:thioredoxin fold domain-containing protein [Cupriavidus pinatubonensis]QYY33731.1 thioredoxin fold domain-containing protein [Cupriavidus pinatubonensis]